VDIACYPYVDHDLEIETMANRAEVLKVESLGVVLWHQVAQVGREVGKNHAPVEDD